MIRFIHPGMEYHDAPDWPHPDQHAMCAADIGNIRAAIDRLLEAAP